MAGGVVLLMGYRPIPRRHRTGAKCEWCSAELPQTGPPSLLERISRRLDPQGWAEIDALDVLFTDTPTETSADAHGPGRVVPPAGNLGTPAGGLAPTPADVAIRNAKEAVEYVRGVRCRHCKACYSFRSMPPVCPCRRADPNVAAKHELAALLRAARGTHDTGPA